MRHHTKDKGDSGVGFVIADLLSHKIQVALPISEHLPFDCIAIPENNDLCRLSVKYRKADDSGRLGVHLRSSWADRHGVHLKGHDKASYDATAVYCPDTGECYYVRNDEVSKSFLLRIGTVKEANGKIRWARDYKDPERLFKRP